LTVAGWQTLQKDEAPLRNLMPNLRPPRRPKPYQRRALALLAGCGSEGCTEYVMRMHGFKTYQLAELVRVGLVTMTTERVVGEPLEIERLKMTEAGDRALGGQQ
jgi:hypothetical protein